MTNVSCVGHECGLVEQALRTRTVDPFLTANYVYFFCYLVSFFYVVLVSLCIVAIFFYFEKINEVSGANLDSLIPFLRR